MPPTVGLLKLILLILHELNIMEPLEDVTERLECKYKESKKNYFLLNNAIEIAKKIDVSSSV